MFNNRLYKFSQLDENKVEDDSKDIVIKNDFQQDMRNAIPQLILLVKNYILEDLFSRIEILDKLKDKEYDYFFNLPIVNNFFIKNNLIDNKENVISYLPMFEYFLRMEFYPGKGVLSNRAFELLKKLLDLKKLPLETLSEVLSDKNSFKDFLLKSEYNNFVGFLLEPELLSECLQSVKQRIKALFLNETKPTTPSYTRKKRSPKTDFKKLTYNSSLMFSDLLTQDKNEFIDKYLRLLDIKDLKNNNNFVNKLEQLWDYSEQDFEFINKLKDFSKMELNGEKINVSEILKYLRTYKPFSLLTGGPNNLGIFWYHNNIDRVAKDSPERKEFEEAKYYLDSVKREVNFDRKTYNLDSIKRGVDFDKKTYYFMLEKYKSFNSLQARLNSVSEWWEKRRNNPTDYNVSIDELLNIYLKLKKDFVNLSPNEIDNLSTYFNDVKFKKILDGNYKYSDNEKFELLVENYISFDLKQRAEILSKKSPELFIKLMNKKYPDLKLRLSDNRISLEKLEDFNFSEIFRKISDSLGLTNSNSTTIPSKHFQEFSLSNSSNEERKVFDNFEKVGLFPIPAKQAGLINLVDDEGKKLGFRIDFLLPCNVREYDGENFTLRSDIIFVGEYFGYYGTDYDRKKIRKIQWQNNLESTLDQRCLHIDDKSDLCSVLKEKNIDSKCFSDFGGELYNVKNINQKKTFYVKSQIQHFLYQYLVNELLWEINYDYNLNTLDNFNQVKENNGVFLDRFEKLLLDVEKHTAQYLVKECADIVESYKKNFARKKKRNIRNLRTSVVYNYRKSPSN
jgi:hypothetical protein